MKFNHVTIAKFSLLGLAALGLAACGANDNTSSSTSQSTVSETVTEVDKKVEIPADANFYGMAEADKASLYSSLDEITLDTSEGMPNADFSNVKEVVSEQDYNDLILSTTNEAKIVYLGFDECPYCRAFTPKLNQLAKEKGVTIYYYNTRKHANDSNFQSAMEVYGVKKVPNAFIVKGGKPGKNVNHNSKMVELEAFINEAAQ